MDKLTVAFDITRIMNSDVQALGNPISRTIGTAANPTVGTEPKLGEQGGGGFGWDDQTVYKLGFAYDWNQKLTLNFGANYGESPIPEGDELLPGAVAPATVEWHATVGLDYKISKKSEIALTYVHAFRKRLSNFDTGAFPISPGGGATIEMVQNSASLTYSFLF
jgi:long-chain fatty acid transport protein